MSTVRVSFRRWAFIPIVLALISTQGTAASPDQTDWAISGPVGVDSREQSGWTAPMPMNTRDLSSPDLSMDAPLCIPSLRYNDVKDPLPPQLPFLAQSSQGEAAVGDEAGSPTGKTRRSVKKDTEEILVQEGGVLVPKGTLVVEPSLNYVHIQNNRLAVKGYSIFNAILFGRFDVEKVRRNILTATLTARYGITNRLQAEFYVPYVYRTEEMIIPTSIVTEEGEQEASVEDNGIGDMGGALSYHAIRSRGGIPDITLSFKFKSRSGRDSFNLDKETFAGREFPEELPTGNGFYGLSGGFTLVKVSDPVVFYGSMAYAWNLKRNVDEIGEINPGNSVEYNLGMATALNEKTSLSFSFQNAFTESTVLAGQDVADSKLVSASLSLGVNYRVSQTYSLFGVINVGLTDDTPDFQVQLNMPFNIKLF